MKKVISILIIIFSLMTLMNQSVINANEFDVKVDSAILLEAETGQVIFEKNANKKVPPASITKIMTLLLALEAVDEGRLSLEDDIVISKKAESMGGSQIFLPSGITLKLKELLKSVAIASANDASVAVAEAVGGSYSNFISMMNKKAKELGMDNTNFANSTGLPTANHYSTARDISIMARELIKHEKVLEWTSTWLDYVDLPKRDAMLVNTNSLINKYAGLDGLKTGHTQEAGFCLTGTAQNNNMRLISVVLDAETEIEREEITSKLLNYGFNSFKKIISVKKGEKANNVVVPSGKKTVTTGITEKTFKSIVQIGQEDKVEVQVNLKDKLDAPIKKGDVIGKKIILNNNDKVGEVNILATEDIEKANIFVRLWRSFVNWIDSFDLLNFFNRE